MHSAIRASIGLSREPHFADRSVPLDERRNGIHRAFAVWNQIEHRIFRRALFAWRILRIRHHETARTTKRRLVVAHRALISIESHSQPRRICLRDKIRFRQFGERSQCQVAAVIAHTFQLHRPLQPFLKHVQFDGLRQSFQWTPRSRRSGPHTRIFLRKTRRGHSEQKHS